MARNASDDWPDCDRSIVMSCEALKNRVGNLALMPIDRPILRCGDGSALKWGPRIGLSIA